MTSTLDKLDQGPAVRHRDQQHNPYLQGFRRRRSADVGLAVEGRDQTVDAVFLQDGSELKAAGSRFTDRTVEIDIGDQPVVAVGSHHVVDFDQLAIGFGDLALDHDTRCRGRLASHLPLPSGISVKALRVYRRAVMSIALGHLITCNSAQAYDT